MTGCSSIFRWTPIWGAGAGDRGGGARQRRRLLVAVPHGERAPFYSPDARAGFFGISPHTTRAELQRAVFEGLAFAIVDALQGYPQGGELYLTGGGGSLGDLAADYRRLYRAHGGLQRL